MIAIDAHESEPYDLERTVREACECIERMKTQQVERKTARRIYWNITAAHSSLVAAVGAMVSIDQMISAGVAFVAFEGGLHYTYLSQRDRTSGITDNELEDYQQECIQVILACAEIEFDITRRICNRHQISVTKLHNEIEVSCDWLFMRLE